MEVVIRTVMISELNKACKLLAVAQIGIGETIGVIFIILFLFFYYYLLFRAAPAAYGSSQARC